MDTTPAQNLASVVYPDNTLERFAYDPFGNLEAKTNRRGDTVTYAYDTSGRIISMTYSDGTIEEFAYDPLAGNLVTVTDAAGTTLLEYDALQGNDLLTKITFPTGKFLQYTYDAARRRTQMVDQDGYEVNYAYNSLGWLAELTDAAGNTIADYTYDVAGRLARKVLGNGTYSTYEYDALDRLIRLVNCAHRRIDQLIL